MPNDESPPSLRQELRQIARAVGNLALGLSAKERRDEARHDEVKGLLMAALTQPQPKKQVAGGVPEPVKVERSDEHTDRFPLASGAGVELSRARQKQIVSALILVAKTLALLALGALFKWVHQVATR